MTTRRSVPSTHQRIRNSPHAQPVLCLKPAIQYTVFEQLRKTILALLSKRRGGAPVKSLTAVQVGSIATDKA